MAAEQSPIDPSYLSELQSLKESVEEVQRQLALLGLSAVDPLAKFEMPKFEIPAFGMSRLRHEAEIPEDKSGHADKDFLLNIVLGTPTDDKNLPTVEITGEALESIVRIFELQQPSNRRTNKTLAQYVTSWVNRSSKSNHTQKASEDFEQLAVKTLQTALGTYRLLLEELDRGGEVLIRRPDRSTVKVILK